MKAMAALAPAGLLPSAPNFAVQPGAQVTLTSAKEPTLDELTSNDGKSSSAGESAPEPHSTSTD